MTVSTSLNLISFIGNGSATNFPFYFSVRKPEHLKVRIVTRLTGAFVELALGDYAATGIGPDSVGGSVTYSGLGSDKLIVIYRIVPYTQDADIVNQSGFYPTVIEEQLDLIVMQVQQIAEAVGRALQLEIGAIDGESRWNARGNEILEVGPPLSSTSAARLIDVQNASSIAGNVPSPVSGQIGYELVAVGTGLFGWQLGPEVYSSRFGTNDVALLAAEVLCSGVLSPPNVRVDEGRSLIVDAVTLMSASVNPRVPVKIANNGRLDRVGAANMTFFDTFTAGRNEVFRNWPSANLSFLRGTDQFPEWYASRTVFSAVGATVPMQKALDKLNFSHLLLDAVNYKLELAGANLVLNSNFGGIIGAGPVRSNLELTNGTVSSAISVAGTEAARLARPVLKDFTITRTGLSGTGGIGVEVTWTQGAIIESLQVDDCLIGMFLFRATNTKTRDVTMNFNGNANGFIGFIVNGGGAGTGALGNASSHFYDCAVTRATSATGTGTRGMHILGSYCGDILVRRFDTLRLDIGIDIDLSTTTGGSNGNADIIIDTPILDYFTTAGVYIHGNTDNRVMVTVIGGWLDPKPNALAAVGALISSTRGVTLDGQQHGIGSALAQTTGVYIDNAFDVIVTRQHFKDLKRGVVFNAATDCLVSNSYFVNAGGAGAVTHVEFTGACKRVVAKDIVFGKGTQVTTAVSIGPACEDIEVHISKTDMTNITTLIANEGTRSRIYLAGPATLLSDTGTDTYLWCEETAWVASVSALVGTLTSAEVTEATYTRKGKQITATMKITTTDIGTASVGLLVTLPKNAKGNFTASGTNLTNGKQCGADLLNGTNILDIRSPSNSLPIGNGQQIVISVVYECV